MGSANVILYAKWRMNAPVFTTPLTNKTCPVNDSVTFTVVASGADLSYKWQKNGMEIAGATASSYKTPALTADDVSAAITYRCIASNSAGSVLARWRSGRWRPIVVIFRHPQILNVYHLVKIGTQVWTMENLRVTKYNDNTPIPLDTSTATWTNAATPKYCYYGNTMDQVSIRKYGALYNWYVVSPTNAKKIAPAGWHIPTDAEWNVMQNYLTANGYNWDGTTTDNKIAKSLAAKTDWSSSDNVGAIGNNLSMNNRSGFSALPNGIRTSNGPFNHQLYSGFWWSASEIDAIYAWSRFLNYSSEVLVSRNDYSKDGGFSIRLLRD